jgi:hypothetical protein
MARLVSDGKSVPVTLKAAVTKGDDYIGPHNTADGFFGFPFEDGASGDAINCDISQREYEVEVPGGVAAAKGAVLYLDATTGAITATSTSNIPFMQVTVAKDANNIVWGILLPQA